MTELLLASLFIVVLGTMVVSITIAVLLYAGLGILGFIGDVLDALEDTKESSDG